MTREEAFKTLKENICTMCVYTSYDMESCDIRGCDNKDAIKALEQESKTGQENINAVLENIVDWATHHDYGFISVDCSIRHGVYLDELIEYIKSIYVDEVEE